MPRDFAPVQARVAALKVTLCQPLGLQLPLASSWWRVANPPRIAKAISYDSWVIASLRLLLEDRVLVEGADLVVSTQHALDAVPPYNAFALVTNNLNAQQPNITHHIPNKQHTHYQSNSEFQ
jgi:hypothetical protein